MKRKTGDAGVVIRSCKRIYSLIWGITLGSKVRTPGFLNCFLEAPLVRLETLKYESTFPN